MTDRAPLSRRADAMPASPIRRLAPFAVEAARAGKTVYSLNIGQPDIATPPEILDRLRDFPDRYVPYGPSQGIPEFVDALRAYYASLGIAVEASELFVTNGGSEAIVFTFAVLCDPGDQVLVFEPFYTNYSGFATEMASAMVALAFGRGWPEVHATIDAPNRDSIAVVERLGFVRCGALPGAFGTMLRFVRRTPA